MNIAKLKGIVFMRIGKSVLLTLCVLSCGYAHAADISIATGWSLLGYSGGTTVKIEEEFNDSASNKIISVWKWSDGSWSFWSPSMSAAEITTYTTGKGFSSLSELNPGEGYWINADSQITLNDFASDPNKTGNFESLRTSDNYCHGYTFNPHTSDLTIAISGSQLTITEDDFFDKKCIYTAKGINSPLTGTFKCANNTFDEGTFTLAYDATHESDDIYLVLDVVTTNRSCNYRVKFLGFRK
ncbi:MAG: hypothetical protein Q8J76_07700 [Desulfobulbaceae bacterium]|nr:hypothetical protein [Desulfobulbaceae bacterium]